MFLIITVIFVGIIYYNRQIKSITCDNCSEAINKSLVFLSGERARLVSDRVLGILKPYPEIGSFVITEKGWGNLQLRLENKKPLFSVKQGSWYYHYDWEGRFANKTTDQKHPTLIAPNFNEEVVKGLRIVFFFAKLETINTAEIIGHDLIISTPEIKVVFPLIDDYRLLIAKYYYIKNNMIDEVKKNLVVNNETPITIDLRYQRPIAYR